MAYIWIKTTNDKYEHIIAMGDTLKELAVNCHIKKQTISRYMWQAKKNGKNCVYKKVVIEDEKQV